MTAGFIDVTITPSQITGSMEQGEPAYRHITKADGSNIQNKDGTRVKIGLTLMCLNRFERVKKGKRRSASYIDVVTWVSTSLLPKLVKGKNVEGIGSLIRYQGPARGATILATCPDLEEARQIRDEHKAEHPEAGIFDITTEDGKTLYQVHSKVVDRTYVELDQIYLAQDAYVDQSEEIAKLEKQVKDLQAYASEHSGQGISQEALDKLQEALVNTKATKAELKEAITAAIS